MGGTARRLLLVSLLLAGCGSVDSNKPVDANLIDADLSGDATVVTETAVFGSMIGAKLGNIDVISNLPNGMMFGMTKTDAGGNGMIKVYEGGSVTAFYKHTADMGADLITWVGVKRGDTLSFGNRNPAFAGPVMSLGAQTYTWTAQPGATSYQIFTSCGGFGAASTATSLAVTESVHCHHDPMDVVFLAITGSMVSGYNFRSNATFSTTVPISITGWATPQNATINITGLSPDITSLSGSFRFVVDAREEYAATGASYNGQPTGGAFSNTFVWPTTGERTVGFLSLGRTGFSSMVLLDPFSTSTLTQTVAAPAFPPWEQSGPIASSALRKADWFVVPDAASASDGQVLRLAWTHVVAGVSQPHRWYFILPPGQTSIELPKLPSQFDEDMPFPQDFMSGVLRTFDIAAINGYDAVRAMPSRNVICLECAVRAGELQRVVFTPITEL